MALRSLPLVHIPPATRCYPLGTSLSRTGSPAPAGPRRTPPPPLLTFAVDGEGLRIPSDGRRGFACVGDGDGRSRLVQVRAPAICFGWRPDLTSTDPALFV